MPLKKLCWGGGVILDPQGFYCSKPDKHRLVYLESMAEPTPDAALRRLLEQDQVVDLALFRRAWNMPHETKALPGINAGRAFYADDKSWLTSRAKWSATEQELYLFRLPHGTENVRMKKALWPDLVQRAIGLKVRHSSRIRCALRLFEKWGVRPRRGLYHSDGIYSACQGWRPIISGDL